MNTQPLRFAFAATVATAFGCGGSAPASTFDADPSGGELFAPAAGPSPTGDSIYGLYAGQLAPAGYHADLRMRLEASSAEFAVKCTRASGETAVASVKVSARVTEDEITFLESKSARTPFGTTTCQVDAFAARLTPCKDDAFAVESGACFSRSALKLVLSGAVGSSVELAKLSN